MPMFTYIGYNADGNMVSGVKKFSTGNEAVYFMEAENLKSYEVKETKTEYKTKMYSLVSPGELSLFAKQMSAVFYSHMTLPEGISLLAEQTGNKQLKIALKEMSEVAQKGRTLAEAMNMYRHIFPAYMVNMAVIGENSGSLDRVFLKLSDYYENESNAHKKIRSAIVYPAFLAAVLGIIIILLILRVLPAFRSIINEMGEGLPVSTSFILAASETVSNGFLPFIIVTVVLLAGLRYFVSTDMGAPLFDSFKVKSKLFGYIYVRHQGARVCRSLALLVNAGASLAKALEIVMPLTGNLYLEEKFADVAEKLKKDGEISDILAQTGIFPPLFVKMIVIGQNTGQLDEMLEECAVILDGEVNDAMERLTFLIEPAVIAILTIVAGIILLSVMLPMIDIMTIIS